MLFLSLLVSSVAMAESITSPNGLLKLNVSVNEKGEPVYELSYKGKEVIKPSKLGLELKDDPGLMDGLRCLMPKLLLLTRLGSLFGARLSKFAIIIMNLRLL